MDNSRGNVRILSGETTKCVAEYDFIPENTNELKFNEGDIITIIEKIDNNWYMGALDGKEGIFPKNFVKLV
ncbi:hypothetical protein A3Q56_05087 [Intoshia linei]|uniref:SH3 domain-containing protein n=1 Tax=Intoshia linei TaxID=1819745 RepID=A0A177AZ87_9BILA|nr:hypothetical protein A3Q56_05087 [Intoshia linei]